MLAIRASTPRTNCGLTLVLLTKPQQLMPFPEKKYPWRCFTRCICTNKAELKKYQQYWAANYVVRRPFWFITRQKYAVFVMNRMLCTDLFPPLLLVTYALCFHYSVWLKCTQHILNLCLFITATDPILCTVNVFNASMFAFKMMFFTH